jgi:hypothetical protein
LDGGVPARDDVTSLTATDGNACHAAFTTTHWSVVLEARGESSAAEEALESLCRTYWRPIYTFARAKIKTPVIVSKTKNRWLDVTQGS